MGFCPEDDCEALFAITVEKATQNRVVGKNIASLCFQTEIQLIPED
jgi:hypothetical protein